jgi:Domain of unknown function (DUF4159)
VEVSTVRTEATEAINFSTDLPLIVGVPQIRHFLTAPTTEDIPQSLRVKTNQWTRQPDGYWEGNEQSLFEEQPQPGNSFYLVIDSDDPLDGNVLAIDFKGPAATPTGINPNHPPRVWEACDGEVWQPILLREADDITKGFSFYEISQQGNNPEQGSDIILHLPTTELCRILIQPKQNTITHPTDVFLPGYNNIDLNYRRSAQARPQSVIRMAQINHSDSECARNFFNLSYLMQSLEALYPFLRGAEEVSQATFEENIQEYDLLYLTGRQALSLNSRELEFLKIYLRKGGVFVVDAPANATELIASTQALAQQLETPLKPLEESRRHPLRIKPFLFSGLPLINQQPVKISVAGGIVLVVGDLASAWGLDRELNVPRLIIRTAQELGVNILHYAWRRRQLVGLQQEMLWHNGKFKCSLNVA